MSASRRAIFRNTLLSPPAPLHFIGGLFRAGFSSVHQSRGENWVDDIRKGPDGDGTTGMSDRRKETMRDSMDRAKEGTRNMADTTRDTAGSVADMAKEGAVKAMETGIEWGEKTKQTLDAAWDGVKETTKNVKDAVVGDADSHKDDEPTNQPTDRHVENLRKRAGGYDLRDK